MIVDTIDHASQYEGIGEGIRAGLEYLAAAVREPPPPGRHEIAGSRVYASVSAYRTAAAETKSFEAHRKFIDIQMLLRGRESLSWAPLSSLTVESPYVEADDCIALRGEAAAIVPLVGPLFSILFPQDAHMPGCILDRAEDVLKIVVKIAV